MSVGLHKTELDNLSWIVYDELDNLILIQPDQNSSELTFINSNFFKGKTKTKNI